MKLLALTLLAAALVGCRAQNMSQVDEQVVCQLRPPHKAFYVKPGAMDVSFLVPVPDADKLCTRLEAPQ